MVVQSHVWREWGPCSRIGLKRRDVHAVGDDRHVVGWQTTADQDLAEGFGDHDDQGCTAVEEHLQCLKRSNQPGTLDDPEFHEDARPEIAHFEDIRHTPEPMCEADGDDDKESG